MQCIAWDQALLWGKNCKNWRYKAQKLASEVSWVADWGRKRVVPPFPLSSITSFFNPFPQLWSLVPGYCMFCWVVNKVHPDEHQLVTTQLLLLQYIYWLQLLFYWYNNNNSHSIIEASSTLIFSSPVVPWVSCCHNGVTSQLADMASGFIYQFIVFQMMFNCSASAHSIILTILLVISGISTASLFFPKMLH